MNDVEISVVKDTASTTLAAMLEFMSSAELRHRVGFQVANLVKENFRALPPNKQGWASQGFYEDCARGTAYEITEDGARVTVDNENAPGAVKFAYNRGQSGKITINAQGKLLTIPAREEFYGHRAGEFTDLKFIPFKSGAKALVIGNSGSELVNFATGKGRSSGGMGRSKGGIGARSAGMVAYWLVDHVTQSARPWIIPSADDMRIEINDTISEEFNNRFGTGGTGANN